MALPNIFKRSGKKEEVNATPSMQLNEESQ